MKHKPVYKDCEDTLHQSRQPFALYMDANSFPLQNIDSLRSAVNKWNKVVGYDLITIAGFSEEPFARDTKNIIYYTELPPNENGATTNRTQNDIFVESDIRMNTSKYYDPESVYLHELGHAIGVLHSKNPEDVMYPYIGAYEIKNKLTEQDIKTARCLYGTN
jgi:predicted Zn-dependent protease